MAVFSSVKRQCLTTVQDIIRRGFKRHKRIHCCRLFHRDRARMYYLRCCCQLIVVYVDGIGVTGCDWWASCPLPVTTLSDLWGFTYYTAFLRMVSEGFHFVVPLDSDKLLLFTTLVFKFVPHILKGINSIDLQINKYTANTLATQAIVYFIYLLVYMNCP